MTRRFELTPYLCIAGVCVLVYFRVASFDFVDFDDGWMGDQLPFLTDFSNLLAAFRDDVFRQYSDVFYRPILCVSLMVDAHVSGAQPTAYHVTNVLLHVIASCTLFPLLRKLGCRREPSLAATLIYALLPAHTQAVSWVMGRNDSLLACFTFPSFYFFLRFSENRSRASLFAHLGFFMAAIFTKESGVAIPAVCVAYLVICARHSKWGELLSFAGPGWVASAALWWIARDAAFAHPVQVKILDLIPTPMGLIAASTQLVGKVVLPVNQSVLPIVRDTSSVYGAISVVILIALIFATKPGTRSLSLFGVAWMVIFLAPTMLQNKPSGSQQLLEHRMYIPSFGFILILVQSRLLTDFRFGDRRQAAVLAALLIVYAALIVRHQENFRNATHFWGNAVRTSPHSAVAQFNLGATYQQRGDLEQAEALYHRALELDPNQSRVQNNLGLIYVARGQYWHAIHAFEREIALSPLFPEPYFNLAMAKFDQRGKVVDEEILALVMRTLELSPDSELAREFLVKHQARIEESTKSDDR